MRERTAQRNPLHRLLPAPSALVLAAALVLLAGLPAVAAAKARVPRGAPASSAVAHKKVKKPALHGDPLRAKLAFEGMQKEDYIPGSGLYVGEPFSTLWGFGQALAATVTLATVPALSSRFEPEIKARLIGLNDYLDEDNSGEPEGAYTSALPAFDGATAPPTGPGGTKFYDDNDWVGIELVRVYELTHNTAALADAEEVMAFEMAGWQTSSQLACPGGIPFSNSLEDSTRNTVTNAPTAELGAQLYRITGNPQYLQFAVMDYEWVRQCLAAPNGLYADSINKRGGVEDAYWSYNQGTMIGAGTLLYEATGNGAYLYEARQTAKTALQYFTPERLADENPFFPAVYFRNLMYLDSVTHDPPGSALAQNYVNFAWEHLRRSHYTFVWGYPPSSQLLYQAAIVEIYGLLSSSPARYF
jgi:hypothetical protein